MKQNEYLGELERINCYLKKCLWMDFEVCRMNLNSIEIAGRIDEGVNQYAISILFDQPCFIQGPMCFSLDTSRKGLKNKPCKWINHRKIWAS